MPHNCHLAIRTISCLDSCMTHYTYFIFIQIFIRKYKANLKALSSYKELIIIIKCKIDYESIVKCAEFFSQFNSNNKVDRV